MAGLQFRQGSYRVIFRHHGKQHSFTIGEVSNDEAKSKAQQVDYLLMRLDQRLVTLPPGTGIVEFLQYDGKPAPTTPVAENGVLAENITLAKLRDKYLATHEASLEPSTVYGMGLHFNRLVGILGPAFPIGELQHADLQRYVDARTKAKGLNGRKLSPATIKKEVVSLRTAWNWAVRMKLVAGRFPYDGLRYPKATEKAAFQTMAEINRQVAGGGLTEAEEADLWNSLYLTVDEIAELLAHVKATAGHGFLYPLFCVAAHTGARRSEIIRMRITDIDLAGKTLVIHEKKRVKGKATTRRVPLSPFLTGRIKEWLAIHPGGPHLFCHAGTVQRSKKRSATTGHLGQKTRPKTVSLRVASVRSRLAVSVGPLTNDEFHHHFKVVLAASKWDVLRGAHALRHSFISALASKNVDQRLIDEFVGHQSEEQRRRYRHMYPSTKEQAIAQAFG